MRTLFVDGKGGILNFKQAVISCFGHYARARGRASRAEYWYWTLFCFLGDTLTHALDVVLFHVSWWDDTFWGCPLNAAFYFLTLFPTIAVQIRRLHDVDRTYKWLFIELTVVGFFFPILYWNFRQGTKGDNRFGPDPCRLHPIPQAAA